MIDLTPSPIAFADPLIGNAALVDDMIAKETKEWADYVKIAKIEPQ